MKDFKTWTEEDNPTVNLRPPGVQRPVLSTVAGLKVGDMMSVRLHPKDPYPSPGWKITQIHDKTVVVQKAPSLGMNATQVGQQAGGSVGGTLIIPMRLFISMVVDDKPNIPRNRISPGQEQINSMFRRSL